MRATQNFATALADDRCFRTLYHGSRLVGGGIGGLRIPFPDTIRTHAVRELGPSNMASRSRRAFHTTDAAIASVQSARSQRVARRRWRGPMAKGMEEFTRVPSWVAVAPPAKWPQPPTGLRERPACPPVPDQETGCLGVDLQEAPLGSPLDGGDQQRHQPHRPWRCRFPSQVIFLRVICPSVWVAGRFL